MDKEQKAPEEQQLLQRGLGTDLAVGAVAGFTTGVGGAVAQQLMAKLPSKDKPKDK